MLKYGIEYGLPHPLFHFPLIFQLFCSYAVSFFFGHSLAFQILLSILRSHALLIDVFKIILYLTMTAFLTIFALVTRGSKSTIQSPRLTG